MSSLNWSELVKDAGDTSNFEPMPEGDYELKVVEAKATNTQTGKTMFKITTEVQGGPFARRKVWDNLTISPENPKALTIFFVKASALGLGRDYFQTNPTNAQIEAALLNRTFRGRVVQETYQGNVGNKIGTYHRTSESPTMSPTAPIPAAAPAPAPAAPLVATPFDGPSIDNPVIAAPPAPPAPPAAPMPSLATAEPF
jgi:hypothetical protein